MNEATGRFQGVGQGVLQNVLGHIAVVNELDGRPIGTYDVLLDDDRLLKNVPQLLPATSHLLARGRRVAGGSGFLPIAQRGDSCLVTWVEGPLGLAQPFILGFFSPRRQGIGGDQRNERRIVPGSMGLITPYGNGLVLHNGGVVELVSEPGCKRTMTPTSTDASVGMQALIAELCRNYRLRTAAGELSMTEIGQGRTRYRCRINEFSPFGQGALSRQTRSAAGRALKQYRSTGLVDGVVDDARLEGGDALVERYVEVTYGSAGDGDLYRESFVGARSVTLSCDGDGTFRRVAGAALEDDVGALTIRSSADGTREEEAITGTFTYAGSVTYTTAVFRVNAPVSQFSGILRIGQAGLPSARIGDLVIVGDRVGSIITGQANLIH